MAKGVAFAKFPVDPICINKLVPAVLLSGTVFRERSSFVSIFVSA